MTLDITDNYSPVIDREDSPPSQGGAVLPSHFQKIKENYDEYFEKQRWEDEGGADFTGPDSLSSRYGVIDENPIIKMVDHAFEQLDEEATFEDAVATVSMAMDHAEECRKHVRDLVRYAIDRLASFRSPADPPHPGALELVKRRQKLAL